MLKPSKPEIRVFNNQGQFKVRYSRRTQILTLAGFVGLCLAVDTASSGITANSIHTWYLTLDRPPLTPPNWAFPVVWTTLHVMIGVAAWLIWRQPDVRGLHQRALIVWGWQLGINALWTPVFFGLHLMLLALAVVTALFAAVAVTILRFRALNSLAAMMMAPYLLWVGFAAYLNAGFWLLNR